MSRPGLGITKLLDGIMKYRMKHQRNMLEQFQRVRDNPAPTAVFITCVDSRVLPTRFTETNVGDMFIVRNAGNIVPHSSLVSSQAAATEPAVLELACVMNGVKHVVICGHSDCKAINLLYDLHTDAEQQQAASFSPLRHWVSVHGRRTMHEFAKLEAAQFRRPLLLNKLNKTSKFPAYVDVDEKFTITDKLSMVNTLLQMENVTSYPFMRNNKDGRIHIHCFWFDIYTGEIWCFSRKEKTFIMINDETVGGLEEEAKSLWNNVQEQSVYGGNLAEQMETMRLAELVRRNFSTQAGCGGGCRH